MLCDHCSATAVLSILTVSASPHCYVLVQTPSGAYCCASPAVYPTAPAPPICPLSAVLLPPTHDPAPLSQLTVQMSSCSLAPCCHQYPLLPPSASPLLVCYCGAAPSRAACCCMRSSAKDDGACRPPAVTCSDPCRHLTWLRPITPWCCCWRCHSGVTVTCRLLSSVAAASPTVCCCLWLLRSCRLLLLDRCVSWCIS